MDMHVACWISVFPCWISGHTLHLTRHKLQQNPTSVTVTACLKGFKYTLPQLLVRLTDIYFKACNKSYYLYIYNKEGLYSVSVNNSVMQEILRSTIFLMKPHSAMRKYCQLMCTKRYL
jgi:hypothetical protein